MSVSNPDHLARLFSQHPFLCIGLAHLDSSDHSQDRHDPVDRHADVRRSIVETGDGQVVERESVTRAGAGAH